MEFYCQADQYEADYNDYSTEDDSDAVRGGVLGYRHVQGKQDACREKFGGSYNLAQMQEVSRRILYAYPACTSLALTIIIAAGLIYFDTFIGAQICAFSRSQILLLLVVICILAKKVFIPSRANRFIDNSALQACSSTSSASAADGAS